MKLSNILHRKLRTAIRLIREDRRHLWRHLLLRVDRYLIYGADVSAVEAPVESGAMIFRRLADDEVTDLPTDSAELKYVQKERLQRFGFNAAYAVFCDGEISHVSWLIMPQHEAVSGGRIVGLREGEAEITACFTLPGFRGRGVYPHAIRSICRVARERGVRRVFMKTTLENYASQRGMLKAGLANLGRIVRISFPLLGQMGVVAYRGHRLPAWVAGRTGRNGAAKWDT